MLRVLDLKRGIAAFPYFLKNAAQTWKLWSTFSKEKY